jgi:hypothetical protein
MAASLCNGAHEATSTRGPTTVAVRAYHVASRHLVEHRLPVAAAEPCRDAEALVSDVVELEYQCVGLSAIDTRMIAEKGQEIRDSFRDERAFPAHRVLDVTLAMD